MDINIIKHKLWVQFNRNIDPSLEYEIYEDEINQLTRFTWVESGEARTEIKYWVEDSINISTEVFIEESIKANFANKNEDKVQIKVEGPVEGKSQIEKPINNLEEKIITMKEMSDIVWGKDSKAISYWYNNKHHECVFEGVKYIAYID